jgi:hypothetical protein
MPDVSLFEEISGLWAILSRERGDCIRTARLTRAVGDRRIGVAVDRFGAQHILIPHPRAGDQRGLWRSNSITLSRVNLREGKENPETWLDLHCRRPELEAVFLRLATSVIARIDPSASDVQAACIAALNEWRDLVGQGRGMSPEERVVGLMGEMLLLERLAAADPASAWEAWEGPHGGRHDFRRGSHAVEVKTTLRRNGRFVQIHGAGQLEEPPGGNLHLVFVRLERVAAGNHSVAGVAERLTGFGIPRDELHDIIRDHGIEAMDTDAARAGFEILEWLVYRVGSDFPRIVPASFAGGRIPDGVMTMSYTIDLTAPPPSPLPEEVASEMWRTLISV